MRLRSLGYRSLAFCLAWLAGGALAATLRVPAEFPTIQAALNAANAGDTVLVAPGTYSGAIQFPRDVTLRSEAGPDLTTIRGPAGAHPLVSIGPAGAVIGFTIAGGSGPAGSVIDGAMRITGAGTIVSDNVFTGNFGGAITSISAAPVIERNVFRDNHCVNDHDEAVLVFLSDFWTGLPMPSAPRVANNVIHANNCIAIHTTGAAFLSSASFVNNTVVGNRVGLHAGNCTFPARYANNIFWGNTIGVRLAAGLHYCDASPPPGAPLPASMAGLDHNLVAGNALDYVGVAEQGRINGNTAGDPAFTDAANGNFRLERGSAAIDAGSDVDAPGSDFEGTPRPIDADGDGVAKTDIGAFEATVTVKSDIWWNPQESGWGISITQHANRQIFAVWYTYDDAGNPVWYTIPDGYWKTPTDFAGTLYFTTAAPFFGRAFDASTVRNHKVGDATLRFFDPDNASFDYYLNGLAVEKRITRQIYGPPEPLPVHGDLWWNESEPGWGIAINEQGGTIFATWYAYDQNGNPQWLVMPGGTWSGNAYTGNVYSTRGPPPAATFDPARVERRIVGTATLTFASSSQARLDFTINGVSGSKAITRQPF